MVCVLSWYIPVYLNYWLNSGLYIVCCFNYIKLAYWWFLYLWLKEIPVFNLPLANHFHASFQVEWVIKNLDWRPHLSFERYNSNYMTVNNFCKLMKLARLSSYWTVFWLFTAIIRQSLLNVSLKNCCEKWNLYNIKLLGWINHLVKYNASTKISLTTKIISELNQNMFVVRLLNTIKSSCFSFLAAVDLIDVC